MNNINQIIENEIKYIADNKINCYEILGINRTDKIPYVNYRRSNKLTHKDHIREIAAHIILTKLRREHDFEVYSPFDLEQYQIGQLDELYKHISSVIDKYPIYLENNKYKILEKISNDIRSNLIFKFDFRVKGHTEDRYNELLIENKEILNNLKDNYKWLFDSFKLEIKDFFTQVEIVSLISDIHILAGYKVTEILKNKRGKTILVENNKKKLIFSIRVREGAKASSAYISDKINEITFTERNVPIHFYSNTGYSDNCIKKYKNNFCFLLDEYNLNLYIKSIILEVFHNVSNIDTVFQLMIKFEEIDLMRRRFNYQYNGTKSKYTFKYGLVSSNCRYNLILE